MTRLSILLLIALVASGLYLVRTSYESRRLFVELERAKNDEKQLLADEKRLDAERQAQATHLRVERVAREKLQMRPITPALTLQAASAPAAASAASGVQR